MHGQESVNSLAPVSPLSLRPRPAQHHVRPMGMAALLWGWGVWELGSCKPCFGKGVPLLTWPHLSAPEASHALSCLQVNEQELEREPPWMQPWAKQE